MENDKLQLKQLLEIHGDDDFDVTAPEVSDKAVLAAIPRKSSVYETALNIRPEIQTNKLNIDAAKLDEKIAKSGYLPTISMNASVSSSNSSGRNTNFGKQLKKNWSNSMGITISMPIFDQKQTKTAISKAKLNTQNSELELLSTQKRLYSEIENYWLDATTAQQQYISAKSNVASMKESYELVSEQFKLGLKNIVELTTGKNNLLSAQQQMLQSKYTALYNISMLHFYEGQKIKL
jgi:outer membrane protein